MKNLVMKTYIKGQILKMDIVDVLKNEDGEFAVDKSYVIGIGCVLAGVAIALASGMLKNVIAPELEKAIKSFFSFK